MESLPESTASSRIDRPDRQLPPGGNKVERIAQHSKGLVKDLTSWVELRLKLAQIEVKEKAEAKANDLAIIAVVAGLALLGAVFMLITLGLGAAALLIALGLSTPLSYFLGFLLVSLILLGGAAIIRASKPHLVQVGSKKARVDEAKLSSTPPSS